MQYLERRSAASRSPVSTSFSAPTALLPAAVPERSEGVRVEALELPSRLAMWNRFICWFTKSRNESWRDGPRPAVAVAGSRSPGSWPRSRRYSPLSRRSPSPLPSPLMAVFSGSSVQFTSCTV